MGMGHGCRHQPLWEWYRADHLLPESREFDFSKLKWRRTKDRFRSGNKNVSSTRQAQGLDCYSVGSTVVWLGSSGWSAQSPRAVHGLLESLLRCVHRNTFYFRHFTRKTLQNTRPLLSVHTFSCFSFFSGADSIFTSTTWVERHKYVNRTYCFSSIPGHRNHRNDPASVFLSKDF